MPYQYEVNICINGQVAQQIPLGNFQSLRENLTSHVSWVAAHILVTHVCPVYLVDKLVLVFLVLLREVRMLLWCKSGVTLQGVVSFSSDFLQVGWRKMVNKTNGDWFWFYCGHQLLQVIIVGLEKKTCLAQPQGRVIYPGSFQHLSLDITTL